MKKVLCSVGILAMVLVVGLTGCGTNSATQAPNNSQNQSGQTPTGQPSQTSDQVLKDGISKLLDTSKELNKAIVAGDENKIKENGPQLEEVWKTFEDGVKTKYPDLYGKVEQYLDPTVAGSKASPLDKGTSMRKIKEAFAE